MKGHTNRFIGSTVMAIFLNGWILPVGGVASGRAQPAKQACWYVTPNKIKGYFWQISQLLNV